LLNRTRLEKPKSWRASSREKRARGRQSLSFQSRAISVKLVRSCWATSAHSPKPPRASPSPATPPTSTETLLRMARLLKSICFWR
jgi:hypothetical protein